MRFNRSSPHRSHKMPMPACKAYKKIACWHSTVPGFEYCASCQKQIHKDEFNGFLKEIPTLSNSDILDRIRQHGTYMCIRESLQSGALDDFLDAIFKKSRKLLEPVVEFINTTPLKATLLLRVRNHSRSNLCRAYGYMLRNGLFEDNIIPGNCLQCCSHLILYGLEGRPDRCAALSGILFDDNLFHNLLRSTMNIPEGPSRLLSFHSALVLRDEMRWRTRLQTTRNHQINRILAEAEASFPQTWQWGPASQAFLRRRNSVWMEEFIAKAWHPSRMPHWCLDEDEKKCFSQEMYEDLAPLIAQAAAWNVRW